MPDIAILTPPEQRGRVQHFDVLIVGAGIAGIGAACWRGIQAAAETPLTSAHVWNAGALSGRYWLAETWSRRRRKRLAI